MRNRMPGFAIVPILVLGLLAAREPASFAEVYLPLEEGSSWRFSAGAPYEELQRVTGTVEFWGMEFSVIRYEESLHTPGMETYWRTTPEGDVEYWGWYFPGAQFGYLCDPPIFMVNAPLYAGKTWSYEYDSYSLPDTTFYEANAATGIVFEEGVLELPYGNLLAFGILHEVNGEKSGAEIRTDPGGRTAFAPARSASRWWWTEGVGYVQYEHGPLLFQLTELDLPSATHAKHWSNIKALY